MEEQKKVRCAIYTRKSTDEGLDKEFNTLEAQREAGANYILSQKHQGWVLLEERYDDGGFSGGNINRPALKRLIHDVEAGKIDMIVVYKIDRLTRSLADFSKLIEVLDKHKCSFVSVTQNFNTYDSMGRLTLNVLLSFAQFEREVGAERIRDKVAASRKKGMWMGGKVPFGYMLINKPLEINPTEAEIVRLIFNKYIACKSERDVCTFLKAGGYCINARKQKNGTELPAKEFTVSKIDYMLRNPIYIGKVVHKGTVYDGQQEAIISKELWERVENTRLGNRHGKLKPSRVVRNALLKGMLECGCGCNASMIPTRTRKKNRTYEYYVSLKAVKEGYQHCELGSIPVGELDKFVLSKIQNILKSPLLLNELLKYLKPDMPEIGMNELLQKTKAPEDFFTYLSQDSLRQILERLISRVIIYKDKLVIRLLPLGALLLEKSQTADLQASEEHSGLAELVYHISFSRKRGHMKVIPAEESQTAVDETLLNALVKAHNWRDKLENSDMSLRELARKEKVAHVYISKMMKLTYLAPDIIDAIIVGTQPQSLKISDLLKSPIPASWSEQRTKYGFSS